MTSSMICEMKEVRAVGYGGQLRLDLERYH